MIPQINELNRRQWISGVSAMLTAGTVADLVAAGTQDDAAQSQPEPVRPPLGLVTYNWGKNWDLPTVIRNCEATGFEGVELRSTHQHGVEISINAQRRRDVRKRFADSPVEIVGLGSACEYHSADKAVVKKNIEETKAFVKLCHDIGGTGVKVRPNGFPKDVPQEKTLNQIGKSLREVAEFGEDYGVAIRLEVHGRGTSEPAHIKTMMDSADHPNAVVCWNCNPTDLTGKGLSHNFHLVADKIGTVHIHDLRNKAYPWTELVGLLNGIKFTGWCLLEEGKVPKDIVEAMKANRQIWNELHSKS